MWEPKIDDLVAYAFAGQEHIDQSKGRRSSFKLIPLILKRLANGAVACVPIFEIVRLA